MQVVGTRSGVTDEERWVEAESILARNPTPSARRRIRRLQRFLWILVGALLVVTTIGVVLAVLLGHHHVRPPQVPRQQEILGLALQLFGLVVSLTGFVLGVRSGQLRVRWNVPMTVLTRRQRRDLLKQLRARRPVDPARLALVQYLATRLSHPAGLLVILLGLALTNFGQTVVHPAPWRVVIGGAYALLFVIAAGTAGQRAREARRFLERHPPEGADDE